MTHLAFDLMVGLGSIAVALAAWHFAVLIRRRRLPESRWFYRAAALAGLGAYVTVEAGWVTTEVCRQPWIVYGAMRVSDAVTDASPAFLWAMLGTLVVVYAVIAFFFVFLLLRLGARWRREDLGGAPPERLEGEGLPYAPRAVE
jgi:cytochrome d ubiquinol oxidase subunit I